MAQKKIYLSPSDQTKNAYGAGGTTEAIQCRRIADALEKALKRCGFAVKNNKTDSMIERVAESNAWGADLHMPLHTNAYNAKVGGTRIFAYNKTGEGWKAANKVFARLAPVSPGTSDGVSVYADLYEVAYTTAPCVYVESEFHDNPEYAKWIINHVEDIAEAICKGICDYFGVKYVAPAAAKPAEKTTTTTTPTTKKEETAMVELRVLKQGMSGNDVRTAMIRLQDLGYYKGTIVKSDKLFGPKMDAAVRAFQKAKGLTVDGVIGAKTWPKLIAG